VLQRDGARCTFVSRDGKRCEQTGWLQLHHEDPFARGGAATQNNIRLLCAPHNRLLAERDFGRGFVQQRIERARTQSAARDRTAEPQPNAQRPSPSI
jgi:hypothetical protein